MGITSVSCPACSTENSAHALACGSCGLALPASTLRPGSVLADRYEVRHALGKGGMGMVYAAHDRLLDEEVALKVLRGDLGDSPEIAQRFVSEIKLARRVSHKNVCRIHEYGESRGLRYISMALVSGQDLKKVVRERGGLLADEAFRIAVAVSEGLQAVHDEGIIHRDLKTANVMLDERGVVRLMDFGIAKQAMGEKGITATGLIMGTPEYMSPEQVRGQTLDVRSDVYSLGVLVYELFTGHTPFQGDTPLATALKHLQDPPPFTGEDAVGLPALVVPVLARALAKSPEERFASAAEMAQALRVARDSAPGGATTYVPVSHPTARRREPPVVVRVSPDTGTLTSVVPGRPPVPPAARRPAWIAPVAAGAVALSVIAAVGLLRGRSQAPPSPLADVPILASPAPPTLPPTPAPESETRLVTPSPPVRQDREPSSRPAARPGSPAVTIGQAAPVATIGQAPPPPRGPEPRLEALVRRAEASMERADYDAAIALYDEVLQSEPGHAIARMARATAINAKIAARASSLGSAPAVPSRSFVATPTVASLAESRDKALAEGFDTTSAEITRDTSVAPPAGRLEFEADPKGVKAGDRFTLRISFVNTGRAPVTVGDLVVTTQVNGKRASGAVPAQTRVIAPGQRGLLLTLTDFMRDDAREFVLEAALRTTRGDLYRSSVAWK